MLKSKLQYALYHVKTEQDRTRQDKTGHYRTIQDSFDSTKTTHVTAQGTTTVLNTVYCNHMDIRVHTQTRKANFSIYSYDEHFKGKFSLLTSFLSIYNSLPS